LPDKDVAWMFKAALERGDGNYGHMENPASADYRTPVEWKNHKLHLCWPN